MLFDQVAAAPLTDLPQPYLTELILLKRAVAEAEHFVVDPSLAHAADSLSREDVIRVYPFVKPPHERMWIEVAHADRLKFNAKPVPDGLIKPKRVGLLIEAAADLGKGLYDLTLVWDVPEQPRINACALSAVADFSGGKAGEEWIDKVHLKLADKPLLPFIFTTGRYSRASVETIAKHDERLCAEMLEKASGDWSGEPWFWSSVLALLNAKGGAQAVAGEDRTRLNVQRVKSGKLPLAPFHVLRINVGKSAPNIAAHGHGDREGPRAHMVRGHFKVRSGGMFWWGPHVRGDLAKGFASKRYDLREAKR